MTLVDADTGIIEVTAVYHCSFNYISIYGLFWIESLRTNVLEWFNVLQFVLGVEAPDDQLIINRLLNK